MTETSQSGWRATRLTCPLFDRSSIVIAEHLLCGDAVGNTERYVEPSVLAIACGQLVGAGAQFLQLGDGLVVKAPKRTWKKETAKA